MAITLNGTTGITTPDINTTAQSTDITTTGDISAVDVTASGGVYLGGTAAANYLDDYEEGTWTPTNNSDATGTINSVGTYVKVGRLVTVSATIVVTANFTGADFGGLPYQPEHNATYSSIHGIYNAYCGNARYVSVNRVSSLITLRSSLTGTVSAPSTSDGTIRFTFTYQTS